MRKRKKASYTRKRPAADMDLSEQNLPEQAAPVENGETGGAPAPPDDPQPVSCSVSPRTVASSEGPADPRHLVESSSLPLQEDPTGGTLLVTPAAAQVTDCDPDVISSPGICEVPLGDACAPLPDTGQSPESALDLQVDATSDGRSWYAEGTGMDARCQEIREASLVTPHAVTRDPGVQGEDSPKPPDISHPGPPDVPAAQDTSHPEPSPCEPQLCPEDAASGLSDWGGALPGQDQKLQVEVALSPEGGPVMEDHAASRDGDTRLSQERDPGGAETGLEVLDSQILGALEESLCEPAKSVTCDRQERAASSTTQQPAAPGRPESREEDASSTVQGLILELSNLNRLIMSTHRDLRQRRGRTQPGRGAACGKRRRDV